MNLISLFPKRLRDYALAFIAPGGSGKSTLMDYLRLKKCCLPDGRAVLPCAHLNFTFPSAPKDLLSILVALRDQLQQHADGQGHHLAFPRFDLGALIAQTTSSTEDLSAFGPHEVRRKLTAGKPVFESLDALGTPLGHAVPFVPLLFAGLKLVGQVPQIPAVNDVLGHLETRTGWQWYRRQGTVTGLGADAKMQDVLLRLYVLSRPGKPERDQFVNEVLPAAFVADLYGALVEAPTPQAWVKSANVVIFLDGFEALQRTASPTATRLLQVLAIEPRRRGSTDPLLLVMGSRDTIADVSPQEEASVPFERTLLLEEQEVRRRMQERYTRWQHRLPRKRRFLRLEDLWLPLWLRDFGPADTKAYLSRFGQREHLQVFAEQAELVQRIDAVTHGHPLFVALAAEAVLEADARGRVLSAIDFEREKVSPEIAPEHEAEAIGDYLLELFLRQWSEAERKEFVLCALPRFLEEALLHVLLPSLDDQEVHQRWQTYRRLSFVSAVDADRHVLHPLVRRLLQQRLPVRAEPASDYGRMHTRLWEHFFQRASTGEEQARVEAAYHALALGIPDVAIELGLLTQERLLALWDPLLEAVRQAPTSLMPPTTAKQADEAFARAEQQHAGRDAVEAVVLFNWLLSYLQDEGESKAGLQLNLGRAYRELPAGDRQANLEHAMAYYQAALQVFTREAFPLDWAKTQHNLGTTYSELLAGDRQANFEQAMACYQAALQVRTREAFPVEWASTQHNLGLTYSKLPGEDRQTNLEHAIACYQAALQVFTREAFPVEWASTQLNLGNALGDLPAGDRQANLEHAIACYEAALQVFTHEAFPLDWALTRYNLGLAYSKLPGGDRQINLEQTIAYFEAALQVYSREAFPLEWARTQYNLGDAYQNLPGGDRQANLQQVIACYEVALQVVTREAFPVDWARTQLELGHAYSALPGGDRQANLQQAIACYQAALQILSLMHMDDDSEMASRSLEAVQDELQQLEQSDDLQ